jgi:hypothetical protein
MMPHSLLRLRLVSMLLMMADESASITAIAL